MKLSRSLVLPHFPPRTGTRSAGKCSGGDPGVEGNPKRRPGRALHLRAFATPGGRTAGASAGCLTMSAQTPTDPQTPPDPMVQARRREIVAEHLLFTTIRFVAGRHPELLDALDGSIDHLGDPAGDASRDDEAVRAIARRFVASLRAEARS